MRNVGQGGVGGWSGDADLGQCDPLHGLSRLWRQTRHFLVSPSVSCVLFINLYQRMCLLYVNNRTFSHRLSAKHMCSHRPRFTVSINGAEYPMIVVAIIRPPSIVRHYHAVTVILHVWLIGVPVRKRQRLVGMRGYRHAVDVFYTNKGWPKISMYTFNLGHWQIEMTAGLTYINCVIDYQTFTSGWGKLRRSWTADSTGKQHALWRPRDWLIDRSSQPECRGFQ